MKKTLFWTSAILILIFWPISLILSNPNNWYVYFFPALVILGDFLLYKKNIAYHHLVLILIPLAIFFTAPNAFYNYSIFTPDPLRFDTLIKKISIIPSRNLSRIFENKLTIPSEKFVSNSFVFFDLNNYFFALHPRELVRENQNLQKYSFLTIGFFLYGLFYLPKNKDKWWVTTVMLASVFSLGLINNPDKYDFILYIPISLICLSGLNQIIDNFSKLKFFLLLIYIFVSLVEFIRTILLL